MNSSMSWSPTDFPKFMHLTCSEPVNRSLECVRAFVTNAIAKYHEICPAPHRELNVNECVTSIMSTFAQYTCPGDRLYCVFMFPFYSNPPGDKCEIGCYEYSGLYPNFQRKHTIFEDTLILFSGGYDPKFPQQDL